jgi:hypothetical protein
MTTGKRPERRELAVHFTDFFDLDPKALERYGAFNISLLNDLPLFIDPFLLFNSSNPTYQELHGEIIRYMRFLRDRAVVGEVDRGLLRAWFHFPEVRQNWFGFSQAGNKGHGLGQDFAAALHKGLQSVFNDFGQETVTESSHIEKLTLIRSGVGRDNISDFTTNLILDFLATYTQKFARRHIDASQRDKFTLSKVRFNYQTRSWTRKTFDLPFFRGDFVLLTPIDILTRDEAWINRPELLERLPALTAALPDDALRSQVNQYLLRVLPSDPRASEKEKREAVARVVERFPAVLDYYIRDKEEHGDKAEAIAEERVDEVRTVFVEQIRDLVNALFTTSFYDRPGATYEEAKERLAFMKDVIGKKGGYRIFYVKGKPIERETDLHILYRMTWFATDADVSREVDDGRGPADFKISKGAGDKTLVEFKLAKNRQLERNIAKQVEVYEGASDATNPSLKAILFFTEAEQERVARILRKLEVQDSPHIVLIDARSDNKPSGSRA